MEKASAHCILCGEARREVLIRKGDWTVLRCTGCGLGFLDPRPGADELKKLYAAEYFQEQYDRGLPLDSPEMKIRISQEAHRIRFFRRLKKPGRFWTSAAAWVTFSMPAVSRAIASREWTSRPPT